MDSDGDRQPNGKGKVKVVEQDSDLKNNEFTPATSTGGRKSFSRKPRTQRVAKEEVQKTVRDESGSWKRNVRKIWVPVRRGHVVISFEDNATILEEGPKSQKTREVLVTIINSEEIAEPADE